MRLLPTALVTVLAVPTAAFAAGDGIGDAAHRESQKRQRRPPAQTFTDDDLQRRGGEATASAEKAQPATVPPGAEEKAGADATTAALEREREERRLQESRWRRRFADARARLAAAESASWREVVRTEFYSGVPVPMKVREQVETEDLRQARRALAELEEEFRRTGLPAGWSRE